MTLTLIQYVSGNFCIVDPSDENAPMIALKFYNEMERLTPDVKQELADSLLSKVNEILARK